MTGFGFDGWDDGTDDDEDDDDAPSSRPWWPDRERRRLTGRERLARTRERARMRRAKMRGIRAAHRLGLRGGFVAAYEGDDRRPWAVWHSRTERYRQVWVSHTPGPDACLYCTPDVTCERHDFPF